MLCDNAPVNKKRIDKIRLPQNAFKIERELTNCERILDGKKLQIDNIAKEIVESFSEVYFVHLIRFEKMSLSKVQKVAQLLSVSLMMSVKLLREVISRPMWFVQTRGVSW